jgi:hypothetical protein
MRLLVNQYLGAFVQRGDEPAPLPWNTRFLRTIGDQRSDDVYVLLADAYPRGHARRLLEPRRSLPRPQHRPVA